VDLQTRTRRTRRNFPTSRKQRKRRPRLGQQRSRRLIQHHLKSSLPPPPPHHQIHSSTLPPRKSSLPQPRHAQPSPFLTQPHRFSFLHPSSSSLRLHNPRSPDSLYLLSTPIPFISHYQIELLLSSPLRRKPTGEPFGTLSSPVRQLRAQSPTLPRHPQESRSKASED